MAVPYVPDDKKIQEESEGRENENIRMKEGGRKKGGSRKRKCFLG